MKPVLIVEGKQYEPINVSFDREGKASCVVVRTDTGSKTYHDFSYHAEEFLQSTAIDMRKAFSYGEREIGNKIRSRIDAVEERMIELAMEYIQHEGPFVEKGDLQKEFYQLEQQVSGLWQAIEIVEGKHEIGAWEHFTRSVVESAVILSKGQSALEEGKSFD